MSFSRPLVFIEKILPIKILNEQTYFENGGNPFKGLHRWYSRKPLSFSRASVLGSILPADISKEEFLYLLGLFSESEREYLDLKNSKSEVRLYKTPPTEKQIQKVHDLCEKIWGKKNVTILDAFAGGGSIPFEAVRYGLNVLASDLNPVAVLTMKAAMEYPLKFGADLQVDIDKWVKWVGDQAQKRLAEFFPSAEGETVQTYFWAHTMECPNCQSIMPLTTNWWLSKNSNYAGKGQERKVTGFWYGVKPIPNIQNNCVDFELIKGHKGKDTSIKTPFGEYNPEIYNTISRGVGKCLNCGNVIEDQVIKAQAQGKGLGHQLYAVAYRQGKGSLEFRIPNELDFLGIQKASNLILSELESLKLKGVIPDEEITYGQETERLFGFGIDQWNKLFNTRQLLTLVTYVEIINEAKEKMALECEPEKTEAIVTYLALVLDRCVDANCRLAHWQSSAIAVRGSSAQHSLNLIWNYPETSGNQELWSKCAEASANEYSKLCQLLNIKDNLNTKKLPGLEDYFYDLVQITNQSADTLYHIPDKSIDSIITDPPYYGTIQYAELSDFFYVWQKKILFDIFPELYQLELTDKVSEAVANPSRFQNMGLSPELLAKQDYEAKMNQAWLEAYRVLRDEGVLTVQFNHKDSGAWDVLAKALIDAGFEITASWAVSTENPQNLHQANKNSVSSTVILVCRKRDPNASQAWWDDLRTQVVHAVESRAPEFESLDITGIDLYLSAFGPALNVFSRSFPILDSSGDEVRPEVAFSEARKAIANYRFQKLVQSDTAGFDPLTQWYLLAWDAFKARETDFDEVRQLALAIGGFDVADLAKKYKLIDSASGSCKLLTPKQRLKKKAFTTIAEQFTSTYLVDGLHAAISIYEDENNFNSVRKFLHETGLVSSDLFMKTIEIALGVIPSGAPEKQILSSLWAGIDEIKAKVQLVQLEIKFE